MKKAVSYRTRSPHSLLGFLLDEIEKGTGRLQHSLAGFEDGNWTDGLGTRGFSQHHHIMIQTWRAPFAKALPSLSVARDEPAKSMEECDDEVNGRSIRSFQPLDDKYIFNAAGDDEPLRTSICCGPE